jgi:hypothetical protein
LTVKDSGRDESEHRKKVNNKVHRLPVEQRAGQVKTSKT